jgi:hypothetical protein
VFHILDNISLPSAIVGKVSSSHILPMHGINNAQEDMPSALAGSCNAQYALIQNETDKPPKETQSYIVTWSSNPVLLGRINNNSATLSGVNTKTEQFLVLHQVMSTTQSIDELRCLDSCREQPGCQCRSKSPIAR